MGKKLIEVALPLEEINKASAREKSIRHSHPSTLHLWWARRPLAACRAVLFGSLVDDPSALPDRFPKEEDQRHERERLFQILIRFVQWENSTNRSVIAEARAEVAKSIARSQGDPEPEGEDAIDDYLATKAPPILDPFCGGGSIPLEAQRLGLRAYGSDLNPVAVLITKALIEIPPKFRGCRPVNPEARRRLANGAGAWNDGGAAGLAEDVRYYGQWMRDEAEKRIGHLYPKATLADGSEATVIAWIWARTVSCPNPACRARMPLVRSFALSTNAGRKAWVEPYVDRASTPPEIRFDVKTGKGELPDAPKVGRGAKFRCLACDQIAPDQHIKAEGSNGRMDRILMAIVAEGTRSRTYLRPAPEHVAIADGAKPDRGPEQELPYEPRAIWCTPYGLKRFRDLFTLRQLVAMTTFSDLVGEARERVLKDAIAAGLGDDGTSLDAGGNAAAYADAIATYLAVAVDRLADRSSAICGWDSTRDTIRNTFARQTISMSWDFAEGNPFSGSTGNLGSAIEWISKAVALTPASADGRAIQIDAARELYKLHPRVITTDPPYYDNIGYADLSDFFYVWLRQTLRFIYPDLFSTLATPKDAELIASPYRHGGDAEKAKAFFERGLAQAFGFMRDDGASHFPLSLFYAYKQAEGETGADGDDRASSTGWETMLGGLLRAGLSVSGTWPMQSELGNRSRAHASNALASSIVLVCWPRPDDAPRTTRKEFQRELSRELPPALARLQESDIPPVDLQQAVLGPGMAVFSKYAEVLEADGSPMRVKTALQMINHLLHELLAERVGQMDQETSFCSAWYEQHGFDEKSFGEAEVLTKAKGTAVNALQEAGVVIAGRGKVRLRKRAELDDHWDPATDTRLTGWECAQHLVRALSVSGNGSGKAGGIAKAAELVRTMGAERAQAAHDLAYHLATIASHPRRKWQQEVLAYNTLISAWPDIQDAVAALPAHSNQTSMNLDAEARP